MIVVVYLRSSLLIANIDGFLMEQIDEFLDVIINLSVTKIV